MLIYWRVYIYIYVYMYIYIYIISSNGTFTYISQSQVPRVPPDPQADLLPQGPAFGPTKDPGQPTISGWKMLKTSWKKEDLPTIGWFYILLIMVNINGYDDG